MSKFKAQSSNEIQSPNDKPNDKIYDLEERTARFGEIVEDCGKKLKN